MKKTLQSFCWKLGCFVVLGAIQNHSFAQTSETTAAVYRSRHPLYASINVGSPAPSWIGMSFGYQWSSLIQTLVSMGTFWNGDLSLHPVEVSARVHMFETDFTPMLGAGINRIFFRGNGSLQSLNESSLLLSMLLGLDWTLDNGLRLSAGANFHVPLRLNFPFLNIGWSFK